jgi:hypothetical protein
MDRFDLHESINSEIDKGINEKTLKLSHNKVFIFFDGFDKQLKHLNDIAMN